MNVRVSLCDGKGANCNVGTCWFCFAADNCRYRMAAAENFVEEMEAA